MVIFLLFKVEVNFKETGGLGSDPRELVGEL